MLDANCLEALHGLAIWDINHGSIKKNWVEVPPMGLKRQLHVGAISPKSINIWEFNSSSKYICDPSF